MTGSRHVWLNGQIVPWDAPLLTVTDRGFQLGDGVFETLRARRAVLVEWREQTSGFWGPRGIAAASDGSAVYVTDTGNKRVVAFTADGQQF